MKKIYLSILLAVSICFAANYTITTDNGDVTRIYITNKTKKDLKGFKLIYYFNSQPVKDTKDFLRPTAAKPLMPFRQRYRRRFAAPAAFAVPSAGLPVRTAEALPVLRCRLSGARCTCPDERTANAACSGSC